VTGRFALQSDDAIRRFLRITLFVLGFCPGIAAHAQVPVPELHARVTDLTATLTPDQIGTLDNELAALEVRKGAQIAVLMLATLTPADVPGAADAIEPFATRVFEQWKLGRKQVDDGLLLIVVKDDRKVRIEVGYGLEGAIPDAAVARIIREYVTPRFREGDYYGGIRDATTTLTKLVDGEPLPPPLDAAPSAASTEAPVPWWWSLLGTVFASLMLGFILAASLKCLFNFFPIRVLPIRARRTMGLLAGPSIIAAFAWWAISDSQHSGEHLSTTEIATGSSPLALAAAITGWLGWSMAPEGASKVWAGGLTWKELPLLIFETIIGVLLGGFTGGVVSAGGSGGGKGGFSGGGGSSGGGGASGSW